MASLSQIAEKKKDSFLISIEKLIPDPNNPRENAKEDNIPDLAHSIHALGQLTAATVRSAPDGGDYAIICGGERRYWAIKYCNEKLGGDKNGNPITTMLCVSEGKDVTEVDRLVIQLEQNDSVKPLEPIQRAKAYHKLKVLHHYTLADIAKAVGKTSAHVSDLLKLVEAPEEIQTAVQKGRMSATAAIKAQKSGKVDKVVQKMKEQEAAGDNGKVKVQDVEQTTEGCFSNVTSASIKKMLKKAKDYQYAARMNSKEWSRWEGAVFAFECCLGMHDQEF